MPVSARAEIRFDPARVSLSRVLQSIYALGYEPRPLSFTPGGPPWLAERRTALKRLAVAGFGMMQVMTYAVSLYAGAMDGIAPDLEQLLRFVSLLVSTPVVLYAAQPFFIAAWRGLRMRYARHGSARGAVHRCGVPVERMGDAAWTRRRVLRFGGHVHLLPVAGTLHRNVAAQWLWAATRRHRAPAARECLAHRRSGEERVIPDELCAGDRVRILPGERVPADGEILSGRTEIDESLLTGESQPRSRQAGDRLIAGTLNLSNAVEMRIAHVGQDSTLAAVSRLLERARASRPRIAQAADAVAAWFVAGVLVLAVGVALYWLHADAARAFPRCSRCSW